MIHKNTYIFPNPLEIIIVFPHHSRIEKPEEKKDFLVNRSKLEIVKYKDPWVLHTKDLE